MEPLHTIEPLLGVWGVGEQPVELVFGLDSDLRQAAGQRRILECRSEIIAALPLYPGGHRLALPDTAGDRLLDLASLGVVVITVALYIVFF